MCGKDFLACRHCVVTRPVRCVMEPVSDTGSLANPDHPPGTGLDRRRKGRERRTYSRHGLVKLRAAVRGLGPRVVDRRTTLGRQLAAWKADLVRDLGGDVSTQQAAIIDLAVRTKLLLDSIDAWLLVQPSLVNARKRALLPVVRERQSLADALARYLGQLGLERRARKVPTLAEYLAEHEARKQATDTLTPSAATVRDRPARPPESQVPAPCLPRREGDEP